MADRVLPWARSLEAAHLADGADPFFTALMVDIAVLHNPMTEAPDRADLTTRYLVLNRPCIEMALTVWDEMSPEERKALHGDRHRELHHPEDIHSQWSWTLLDNAQRMVEARETADRGGPDVTALLTISDDDVNQLRRVAEYAKWRPAPRECTLQLHPVDPFVLAGTSTPTT